jgi:plastocyanin
MRILIGALAAGLVVFSACGGGDEGSENGGGSGGSDVTVIAENISYDTEVIEAEPGEEVEVTLQNNDSTEHTISIEEQDVEIEAEGGESATGTITGPESGSVEFFCEYHPDQMRGEVTSSRAAESGGGDSDDKSKDGAGDDSGGGYGDY